MVTVNIGVLLPALGNMNIKVLTGRQPVLHPCPSARSPSYSLGLQVLAAVAMPLLHIELLIDESSNAPIILASREQRLLLYQALSRGPLKEIGKVQRKFKKVDKPRGSR